ncbi:hypothetical protein Tco_0580817 [Tanacetum coccineum]
MLDNDGNPLVPTGIVESDSEVELVFDETANLRIPTSGKDGSDKGNGYSIKGQKQSKMEKTEHENGKSTEN